MYFLIPELLQIQIQLFVPVLLKRQGSLDHLKVVVTNEIVQIGEFIITAFP